MLPQNMQQVGSAILPQLHFFVFALLVFEGSTAFGAPPAAAARPQITIVSQTEENKVHILRTCS